MINWVKKCQYRSDHAMGKYRRVIKNSRLQCERPSDNFIVFYFFKTGKNTERGEKTEKMWKVKNLQNGILS